MRYGNTLHHLVDCCRSDATIVVAVPILDLMIGLGYHNFDGTYLTSMQVGVSVARAFLVDDRRPGLYDEVVRR